MSLPGRATNEPSNYFAMGVQPGFNEEATTFYYLKHLDGTGFDVESEVAQERIGGGGREIGLIYKTAIKADGSMVTYAWPEALGRMLTLGLGADTPSYISGTMAFTLANHHISLGSTSLYATIDQRWADEQERVTNAVVEETKIEGEQGKPIKISQSFITGGTPYALESPLSPTRESGAPLMYPGASANLTFNSAGYATGSALLQKFSVAIKNTLDDTIRLLALNRVDVVWEDVDFTIDATIKYTDKSLWEQVNYFGTKQVQNLLATGRFDFFAVQPGASYSAHIVAPVVRFGNPKVNRLDPDGKTMWLDVTGFTQYGGTPSLFADVITGATTSYTLSTT